ncbi:MAG: geranylgeranyl diphosphate reductase [Pseudomonadota bacterium]
MSSRTVFDIAIIGGGPAGATAANWLAQQGYSVALLDKAGRIKPCGGAIPPRLIRDFDIPDSQIVARINTARVISPSDKSVDMLIEGGFVGMVDREHFDEWLRNRAAQSGAIRFNGEFRSIDERASGISTITARKRSGDLIDAQEQSEADDSFKIEARVVIGADGARSEVARQAIPKYKPAPSVFAYHEIVESPTNRTSPDMNFDGARCDVVYNGAYSPDFYAWVFPHGNTTSVGVGSAVKGFSLRQATKAVRSVSGLSEATTIRREGAPIPLKPLRRWDNGRNVVLAGDAAGVVAPASGEGIYYAMLTGQLAAEATAEYLQTGDARALAGARKKFMRNHGRIFWILRMLQHFWYRSDKRREQFVKICQDKDVQYLTWQSYMHKELAKTGPGVHMRIFLKDLAHLTGWSRA